MSTDTLTMLAHELSELMGNLADEIGAAAMLTNKDEVLTALDAAFRKSQVLIEVARKTEVAA